MSNPTFCDDHQHARYGCGCPTPQANFENVRASFVVAIYPGRGDLKLQLRDAFDLPPLVPIEVEAKGISATYAIGVDRDAWVRLAATREITVRALPGKIQGWRQMLGEIAGAR